MSIGEELVPAACYDGTKALHVAVGQPFAKLQAPLQVFEEQR